jgi:hypothetical protein
MSDLWLPIIPMAVPGNVPRWMWGEAQAESRKAEPWALSGDGPPGLDLAPRRVRARKRSEVRRACEGPIVYIYNHAFKQVPYSTV